MIFNFLKKEAISQPSHFPDIPTHQKQINQILHLSPTPLFITDPNIVLDRLSQLSDYKVAFSFKTNYCLAQSPILNRSSIIAEVVSEYEYKMAKKYQYRHIIYNGLLKSILSLKRAISGPATFIHLDGQHQVSDFLNLLVKPRKFGLRFNPETTTSRFGFTFKEIASLISQVRHNPLAHLNAIHLHIGSDIPHPKLFQKAVVQTNKLLDYLKSQNIAIDYVDFGGGLPAHGLTPYAHTENWQPTSITEYKNLLKQLNVNQIILEPGRFLVDDSTIFITKVIEKKIVSRCQQIICDATVNQLPLIYYRPQIMKCYHPNLSQITSTKYTDTKIFGSSCQESDLIHQTKLPQLNIGDLLIFFCVGAYHQNMTPDFIFNKPSLFFLK